MQHDADTTENTARADVDEILIKEFNLSPEWVECHFCGGEGATALGSLSCVRCGGMGRIEDYSTSPADEFRACRSGCGFGRTPNNDVIWVCGEMIADLMDRAYRAGQDSV